VAARTLPLAVPMPHRFRLRPSSFFFASIPIALLACGSTESASSTSSSANPSPTTAGSSGETNTGAESSDATRPPPADAKPAPDGNGVCCPLENPCGPSYRGGWAAKASECEVVKSWDGSHDRRTDEHGCEEWVFRGIASDADLCCMCAPPPDAGDSG
jgi:hypothetical protein